MAWVASAVTAVSAGVSFVSGKKNAKRGADAANNATQASLDIYDDTVARSEKFIDQAQEDSAYEIQELQKDRVYLDGLAATAKSEGDANALESWTKAMATIDQQFTDASKIYQDSYGDIDRIIGDAKAQEMGIIDENAPARKAYKEALAKSSGDYAAAGDRLAQLRKGIEAKGSRPEGLDAVQSEVQANFRDAKAAANKRDASRGIDPGRADLALDLEKARTLGQTSASMREGYADKRLNQIMALSQGESEMSARAAGQQGLSLQVDQQAAYQKQDIIARYLAMDVTNKNRNTENVANTVSQRMLSKLGVTNGYQAAKNANNMAYLSKLAGNNVGYRAGVTGAQDKITNARLASLGLTAGAGNSSARVYGDIASANIKAATDSANSAVDALGSGIAKIGDYYTEAQKNKKKETVPTPAK